MNTQSHIHDAIKSFAILHSRAMPVYNKMDHKDVVPANV